MYADLIPEVRAMRAAGQTLRAIGAAKTATGGWTRSDLHRFGVPWPPPRGWRSPLERAEIGHARRCLACQCISVVQSVSASEPERRRLAP